MSAELGMLGRLESGSRHETASSERERRHCEVMSVVGTELGTVACCQKGSRWLGVKFWG